LSTIKTETRNCMTGFDRTDGVLTARFLFPAEFSGFQGHFPGQKVLPGVCQILCVLTAVERGEGKAVRLTDVLLAKYAAPVLPGKELACTIQQTASEAGAAVFKAQLATRDRKVTELKLRVALAAETD
jgi:3-hydroxyacyl-[acyl-carrier-protein] dehydratase